MLISISKHDSQLTGWTWSISKEFIKEIKLSRFSINLFVKNMVYSKLTKLITSVHWIVIIIACEKL